MYIWELIRYISEIRVYISDFNKYIFDIGILISEKNSMCVNTIYIWNPVIYILEGISWISDVLKRRLIYFTISEFVIYNVHFQVFISEWITSISEIPINMSEKRSNSESVISIS